MHLGEKYNALCVIAAARNFVQTQLEEVAVDTQPVSDELLLYSVKEPVKHKYTPLDDNFPAIIET